MQQNKQCIFYILLFGRDVSTRYGLLEIPLGEDVELIQGFLGRYLRLILIASVNFQ